MVARFPWPHIYWAPTVPADVYHSSGHILQQLIMFYADRATNETFTAFIDTDAVVMTTVHPEALFEDGSRPIVRGMRGKPITSWWYGPPTQTEWAIGRPEVGCFMTFFPVIIRTAHFAEMRKSMEERHHMPFDRIFAKFSHTRAFSQFNIMMNWLFFHKRDEYAWVRVCCLVFCNVPPRSVQLLPLAKLMINALAEAHTLHSAPRVPCAVRARNRSWLERQRPWRPVRGGGARDAASRGERTARARDDALEVLLPPGVLGRAGGAHPTDPRSDVGRRFRHVVRSIRGGHRSYAHKEKARGGRSRIGFVCETSAPWRVPLGVRGRCCSATTRFRQTTVELGGVLRGQAGTRSAHTA
eukprot:4972113-Prymnesium_polylepis.1